MSTDATRTHASLGALTWPLVFLLTASTAFSQVANLPRADFWVPDGPVRTVVETNGTLYVGGIFDYVGPVSETGNAFDRIFGNPLPSFPKFKGAIKAIVSDNAGGWFVGGLFTAVDGYNITNLAHVRSDWTVDLGWLPNPNGSVFALASGDGMLYVGGSFSRIGGQTNACLAAVDPISGLALAWRADVSTQLTGTKPVVTALVLSQGLLYVGGFFSAINTNRLEHLGAVDALTGQPTSWIPNSYNAAQATSRIDALAISGHILYVGGGFGSIGGGLVSAPPRSGLAALDTTKNLEAGVLNWDPSANGPITSIAVSCDTVYVAGAFTSVGGANRNGVAALESAVNGATGRATSWNPNANGDVLKVVHAGNVIYVGGKFTEIGGQRRSFAAALDTEQGLATPWNPLADFGVAGLAVSSVAVVTGGSAGPGGKQRKNLAAFDVRTAQLLDWSPMVTGSTVNSTSDATGVYALAASTNAIYFGGPFTEVNGQARNRLASVHPVTGVLNDWDPSVDGIVESLALSPNAVFAGGFFTTNGGQLRTNIAALNLTNGAALPSWNPGADGKVSTLSILNNTLYAGGGFVFVNNVQRKYAAAFDTVTGSPTPWNANLDSSVFSVAATANRIYLGGLFSRVGTGLVHRISAVDPATGANTCWKPEVLDRTGLGPVKAIVLSSNLVYAGGSFTNIGGQPRRYLGALDPNCPGNATSWEPTLDASVDTMAYSRGSVVAAGAFQSVGGVYRPNLAVFPLAGSPVITNQPSDHKVNAGQTISLTASVTGNGPLSYQWQRNGTNIVGATATTLIIPSAQVSHSGVYTLVATNALGLINSRLVNVLVVEPVRILTQPLSQTNVSPGTTVTLSVTAAGSPEPIYQWRLNGVDIPGAVQPTLTLTNVQPTNGGSYNVVVASAGAALSSATATLEVNATQHLFANNLQDRLALSGATGLRRGSNVGATHETSETNHVGKLGGASVWARWTAPNSGIATFSTRGSSFDTLLAIYTGAQMQSLVPVASDEDAGGYLTSQVLFSVSAGIEYLIAIDGFGGASGNIVLSWSLDTTTTDYPRFLSQPTDVSVRLGGVSSFSVTVPNLPPVTYQWFHECVAIPGATNSTLIVGPVQVADVGRYHVEVMNTLNRTARSFDASLDIGPDIKVVSQDKLEDILGVDFADHPGVFGQLFIAAADSSGFLSISAGSIDSQTMNNLGARSQLGETNHCNVLGGSSKWFGVTPTSGGTFVIDTIGSSIDTVLAVYRATNLIYLSSTLIACDNNGAPDGIRSAIRFDAVAGRNYLVVVDGVNAAQGAISLNWKFGVGPTPVPVPVSLTVPPGTNVTLLAIASGLNPPPTYQWLFNGVPILGARQSSLTLSNIQSQHAGLYSVVVSNVINVTAQSIAVITVGSPLRLVSHGINANGHYSLSVTGLAGQRFTLQATTNLSALQWSSLLTTSLAAQPFDYLDTNTSRNRQRFYRTQNSQ